MLLHNHLCDGKAQSRATDLARPDFVRPPEPVKDMRQLVTADAHARIAHGQYRGAVFRRQTHADSATGRRVLNCVIDEDQTQPAQRERLRPAY